MIHVVGGTHFLVLRRGPKLSHTLSVFRRYSEVLAGWDSGARVSPIFPINQASIPTLADGGRRWVLFAGPGYPGDLNIDDLPPVFLSLGIFNFVVFTDEETSRAKARAFAGTNSLRWEEWQLKGHEVVDVNFCEASPSQPSVPASLLTAIPDQTVAAAPTTREYVTLIATTAGRASIYLPEHIADLTSFDRVFRLMLADTRLDDIAKQGLLVNANAALSRHSSQTYAGISPIFETECHFWTHSLLGVGIASIALQRLRTWVTNTFAEAQLIRRLQSLSTVAPHTTDLLALVNNDAFWDAEHLFKATPPPEGSSSGETLPLLSCYSGRDGFRSTRLSISAPLEVITSCNTTVWTPLTLTHELSHTMIEGVLGALLPEPSNSSALENAVLLLHPKASPQSLLDQARRLLCFVFVQISSNTLSQDISAPTLAHAIRSHWTDVNETMTHIFDFLYFYQKDSEQYIRSLWASWGVIPNIQSRVSSYLIRSLCALFAVNLRTKNGIDVTIDQLLERLRLTHVDFPNRLIDLAIKELTENRDKYRERLLTRSMLSKFVKGFLYQQQLATRLMEDPGATSGVRAGYDLQPATFSTSRIANPLRFVSAYSTDKEPITARSVWMLHMLAFLSSQA